MFSSLIISLVPPYNFSANKSLIKNDSFPKETIPEPQYKKTISEPQYRELPLKTAEITPEARSPKQTQVALIS
jgi:hypothetical protein